MTLTTEFIANGAKNLGIGIRERGFKERFQRAGSSRLYRHYLKVP
jgi:hypothetical protein